MHTNLHIVFPLVVKGLIDTLEQAGFDAYAVGGCVRDSLLGKTPADWDICTNALPEQICDCFAQYQLVRTGIKHGTVTIVAQGRPFEITTYRIDGTYSDHRHPDHVNFYNSLPADLARRDFTVNAMASHPQKGVIDLYNGAEDLRTGVIRCVGEPHARFQEDALRILRALRFAAVYGFSIASETACAIHVHAPLLVRIATERMTGEICKLLLGTSAQEVLNEFPDVIGAAIPSISIGMQQQDFLKLWKQATAVIAQAEGNLAIALSQFAWIYVKKNNITDEKLIFNAVLNWAKALKIDSATGRETALLEVNRNTPIPLETCGLKRLMYRLGAQQTMLLIAARRAHMLAQEDACAAEQMRVAQEQVTQLLQKQVCFDRAGLAVNGADLKNIGITDGKTIGKLLDQMVLWVINEQVENDANLLLKKIRQEILKM